MGKISRLIMLYKGLKVAASNNLVPQIGVPVIIVHWQFKPHWLGLIFTSPISSPDYNRLDSMTDSLISASECAEDSVAKVPLVRARD